MKFQWKYRSSREVERELEESSKKLKKSEDRLDFLIESLLNEDKEIRLG